MGIRIKLKRQSRLKLTLAGILQVVASTEGGGYQPARNLELTKGRKYLECIYGGFLLIIRILLPRVLD